MPDEVKISLQQFKELMGFCESQREVGDFEILIAEIEGMLVYLNIRRSKCKLKIQLNV